MLLQKETATMLPIRQSSGQTKGSANVNDRVRTAPIAALAWDTPLLLRGQSRRTQSELYTSAVPPLADVHADVALRPASATFCREQMQQAALLFDHLVGELLETHWYIEAEHFGGL